jgi:type II secretory ATPase GspE/PulE/Tfp pilus assembly ATPase PilB-like protein
LSADRKATLGEQGIRGRPTASFSKFVSWLGERLTERDWDSLQKTGPQEVFAWVKEADLSEEGLTKALSEFLGVPRVVQIEADDVDRRILPEPFCQAKLVVPVRSPGSRQTVVLSNPFDWELLEDLERTIPRRRHLAMLLASPSTLNAVLNPEESRNEPEEGAPGSEDEGVEEPPKGRRREDRAYDPDQDPGKEHPIAQLAIALLLRAVGEEASDLMIEARGEGAIAKAAIGGKIRDLTDFPADTGRKLVARFKALAGLDVAKKRTPQSGCMDILLQGQLIKLRLSTSPTAAFENLKIRVLNPASEAPPLVDLGLSPEQIHLLKDLAGREQGLVLFVGPLGSGKTTTIYSLLTSVASQDRSLITIEDPVEHRVPFAVQQEVQRGSGASFRSLLQGAIQEEPDVLFLGEIRDLVTARACIEFTDAGHQTLSSMNSSNAATAVFRLEKLGVDRKDLGEALIGVVAQRILKRLCPECKQVRPITPEEKELLRPFTNDFPEAVGHPEGCSACKGTGYRGQEGVFEVIRVGPKMAEVIGTGRPIAEIREYAEARGDLLIGAHAIQKIRDLKFPVTDVYREVLLEEAVLFAEDPLGESEAEEQRRPLDVSAETSEESNEQTYVSLMTQLTQSCILVAEDEEGTLFLLDQILSQAGYKVIQAKDGGEALLKLGAGSVDLILSDIHMPNLDGLKLLEILQQNNIDTPVVFLTGEPSPDVEARGREMGVADYLRKPIQRDVLLESIEKALE